MNEQPGGADGPSAVREADLIDYHLARQNAAQAYNADMAKWILASLILINGGPFLLLSKDLPTGYVVALQDAAPWFVTGLALAVLCGFLAWLNTGMREAVGGYVVKRLIAGRDVPQSRAEIVSGQVVKASYLFSILTGFGSLATFLVGALTLASSYGG
jgi:hypothetical protein